MNVLLQAPKRKLLEYNKEKKLEGEKKTHTKKKYIVLKTGFSGFSRKRRSRLIERLVYLRYLKRRIVGMKQKKNKEKLFKEEDWFSYVCGFYARVIAKTRKADKEGKKEEKKRYSSHRR